MNRVFGYCIVVALCLAGISAGGCVTAHKATAKIEIFDNATKRKIDDCILLTIRLESLESQGHWWAFQEEKAGHMLPTEALVCTINT